MFDLANIASNNSFDEAGERVILETYFEKRPPTQHRKRAFYAMKAASACARPCGAWSRNSISTRPASTTWPMQPSTSGVSRPFYAAYLSNFGKS